MHPPQENESQSKRYHKIKHVLLLLDIIVSIAFLLLFLFSGISVALRNLALRLNPNFLLVNAFYIFVLTISLYIAKFPLNIYEGYFLEHQFNLSNQKLSAWLMDDIKKIIVSLIVFLITIELIYIVLRYFQDFWWVFAAIIWLIINLVLSKIMPTVIIPLFYKYAPLENDDLRKRIIALFERSNIPIKDVYAIDLSTKTKKANAFVCGLGKNRRVVLGDTLIAEFSPIEIETVVAHELGHYKHRDILKLILWGFLFSFLAFFVSDIFLKKSLVVLGFSRIDDIAFFPMFALCLFLISLIILPIQNWFSCLLEKRADLFSLKITKSADDFISMITKLGKMNLADFYPNRFIEIFLYDHPPISKRIKFAESFKETTEI